MNDLIRKAILVGIGSVYYPTKVAEDKIKTFLKENDINLKESEKFAKEVMNSADEYRKEQQKNIVDTVSRLLKQANLATKEDIEKLEKSLKPKTKKGTTKTKK